MNRLLWLLVGVVSLASCGILAADEERVVGRIDLAIIQPSVPDTVSVSTNFVVSLATVTRGCDRGGETEVRVVANAAFVTPYDYQYTGGGFCTSDLVNRIHDTTVRFDVVGQARVVITARDFYTGTSVEVELPVWVR